MSFELPPRDYPCRCGHKQATHERVLCAAAGCWCTGYDPVLRKLDVRAQKHELFTLFWKLDPFVRVNALMPGVQIPGVLNRTADLVLRVGDDYFPSIVVTTHGFSGMIHVRGSRYSVYVPWEALDALWIKAPHEGPLVAWKDIPDLMPTPERGRRGPLRLVSSQEKADEKETASEGRKEESAKEDDGKTPA